MSNEQRRILFVDDDPDSRALVQKSLEWDGYQVRCAESGEIALQIIHEWQPHLVLLDVHMPGLNGYQTLDQLRAHHEYVSVIFVSAKSHAEDVVRGLDAGADDYICKPFDAKELLARVRCQLRIKDLQDQLRSTNARLKELIDIDDLTGLFNMRSLYKKLDHELDRARRYKRNVCVLMLDMDFFKRVNDEYDHLFGSFVLSEVGRIVRENIRNIDFAARYGGDEFLIVLTETDFNGAAVFSERIRKLIEETEFENESQKTKLTASIGYAITSPGVQGVDARTLVRYADNMLYKSKEGGRNRVTGFDFTHEAPPLDLLKKSS